VSDKSKQLKKYLHILLSNPYGCAICYTRIHTDAFWFGHGVNGEKDQRAKIGQRNRESIFWRSLYHPSHGFVFHLQWFNLQRHIRKIS